jgi:gliding motility-associated-like protein
MWDFQNNCKLDRFLNRMDHQYLSGKFYRVLLLTLVACVFTSTANAQIPIFFDDFGSTSGTCDSAVSANSFVSPTSGGVWQVVDIGPQGATANQWYISATEPGLPAGSCAIPGCKQDPTQTKRTLHVGNSANSANATTPAIDCPFGDCGAVYDPGGFQQTEVTEKRVISPVINCLGYSSIQLAFNYILGARDSVDVLTNIQDNCFIDYFDGTSWSILQRLRQTQTCAADPTIRKWETHIVALPNSASNNPNVKIGFRWKNAGQGAGISHPSIAIDSILVVSLDAPVADFTASDTVICAGDTVNFYADTTVLAQNYNWTFVGGTPATSSQMNPTNIVFANPGTYSVQLIVSSGTGPAMVSDTMTKLNYIVVNSCAPPDPDFVASDSIICERECITFTDLSTNDPTSWVWSFPGGNPLTSTSPNPTVCYTTPGSYDVILTATNQYGSNTFTKTNYIVADTCPLPSADFTATDTLICTSTSIGFIGQILAGGPFTEWSWYFPGAVIDTSSAQIPSGIFYTQDGLYDVQLIVSNQYGSDTIIKYSYIRVESVPGAYVGPDTAMYWGSSYQLSAGGGVTYSWQPALGLDSITSPTPIATPSVSTVYTCTIADGTGCITTRQVIVTILHDNDVFVPTAFSPNGDGANDYLFVRGNNLYGVRLTVYDRWGEKVFETNNQAIGWDGKYNGKELNPGVYTYVVTVNYDDKSSVSKTGSVTLVR